MRKRFSASTVVLVASTLAVLALGAQAPAALNVEVGAAGAEAGDVRLKEGLKLHDAGDYPGAIAVYRSVLADRPDDVTVIYELMYSTYAARELKGVIEVGEHAIQRKLKVPPDVHGLIGSAYDDLGDHDKAAKAFRRGLERFPEDGLLHYNFGVNLVLRGRLEDGARELVESLRLRPERPSGWLLLGDVSNRLGRRSDAIVALVRFLTLEPDSPRSAGPARALWGLMFAGVTEKPGGGQDGKATINIVLDGGIRDEVERGRQMGLALVAATRYIDEWRNKSSAEFFAHGLQSALAIIAEQPRKGDRFWSTCALGFFDAARREGYTEALAYDVRRATGDPDTVRWLVANAVAVEQYQKWAQAYRDPQCGGQPRN